MRNERVAIIGDFMSSKKLTFSSKLKAASTKTALSPTRSRRANGDTKRNAKSLFDNSSRSYKKLGDGEKKKWSPDRSNRWHASGGASSGWNMDQTKQHQALHEEHKSSPPNQSKFSFLPQVYMEQVEVLESLDSISRLSTNVSSWSTEEYDSGSRNDQSSHGKAKKAVSFMEQNDDTILAMPSSTSSKPRRLTHAEKETLYAERPDLKNCVNTTPWDDDVLWDVNFLNETLGEMKIVEVEREEVKGGGKLVFEHAKKQALSQKGLWNWILDYNPCAAQY
eukprot:CAMPEP_0116006766 /NCGR_PEP_ID=MMETSP0321-20121206/1920_1 /TAXON_ID=163516 /ORGANISM="Leptocylindrus danicus var. danicus, Strain B650" /LENGTH=278 /DNA_ID=CAMNT_0003475375 /DNA_START=75 /DNA_END=912 /DNA_ORIENTATION=+